MLNVLLVNYQSKISFIFTLFFFGVDLFFLLLIIIIIIIILLLLLLLFVLLFQQELKSDLYFLFDSLVPPRMGSDCVVCGALPAVLEYTFMREHPLDSCLVASFLW